MRVDSSATQGRFGPGYFEEQAREFGAPAEWAASAGSVVTAVEAQRASAEATRVRAAADHAASLAEANQLLAGAVKAFETQNAESRRQRASAEVGYSAEEAAISARGSAYGAEVEAKLKAAQAGLDAAIRRAEVMRGEADEAYARAEAEYERQMAEAASAENRTRATIEQMRASAGAVMSRAEGEARSLTAEGAARRASWQAQASVHESEIDATRSWAETGLSAAQRELEAARSQTQAEVESIRAQADRIKNWDLDEQYSAAIAEAGAAHETALARATMLRETATIELGASAARLTTDRTDLKRRLEADGLTYEAELARIDSDTKVAEARASIALARAQELEHDARARFISALADLVGGETHAERSRAFAWAQGLADDVAGRGEAPAALNLDTPEVTESINGFIGQLAEARALRDEAGVTRDNAKTGAIMRRSQIEVWWSESRAAAEAALEGIAHAETEKVESLRQQFADADEIESHGRIAYEQACLEAESAKQEAMARLADLHEQEAFALRSGAERSGALEARAVAIREHGAEEIARLSRMAEAARSEAEAAAGELEAQAQQCLARARMDAESFSSMALAAETSFEPEYEARVAAANGALASARADYEESMRAADSVVAFADAAKSEAVAAIEFERAAFESDSRSALSAALARRDDSIAAAEEALARATASYASFQADDTARRAEAEAVEQSLLAFVEQQHAVADAQDAAVIADFGARLATLQAGHDRAYADAYFAEFLSDAGLTPADMKRYVETANAALGRLRDASSSYAVPAVASETGPVSTDGSAGVLQVESMSANGVATVPTDDDE